MRRSTGAATWRERGRGIASLVGVAAAVALPWHAWQVARLGRPFLAHYLGYNVVARVGGSLVGGDTSPLFYVERLLHMEPLLGPALLVLAGACALLWIVRRRDARLGAIVLPLVVMLVAFSLSRSRLYKYVYPAAPSLAIAAAVVVGRALDRIGARVSPLARRWIERAAPLLALAPAIVFFVHTVPVTAHAGPDLTALRDLSLRARDLLPDGQTLLVFDDYHVAAAFYADRPTLLVTPSEHVEATLLAVPGLKMSDTIRRVAVESWPALLDASPRPVALARRDYAPLVVAAMKQTHHGAPRVEEEGGYDLIYPPR